MAPTAEVEENLVEVQVGVEPGSATKLIKDLRVGVEPIVEAQNVEGKVAHTTHWPTPATSRRTPRIRVKYSGKAVGEVRKLLDDEVMSKPKKARIENVQVKFLKEKVKEWERKDDVASMYENGESSNAPTRVSILGEPMERTLVTLVTRCAQHENQITTLKTKVGVLDEVDEAMDERLKTYDEERVMQEHTLFQLNDRVRKLEEEMMEH
ncbi:hypothetical protein QVD17_42086 [Tagetes erecta]|uniref:Uncharacterized protein n=1 Tax=Tagetes erecta TaxID=13708 RepID=A0AAD8JNF4_TARER|nr:hypothetical protein QVD17_42086 [Tagetes erecta]